MIAVELFVGGKPTPKGSWKPVPVKGKTRFIPDNARSKPWAETVSWAARAKYGGTPGLPTRQAVGVHLEFYFVRPASHIGKRGPTKAGRAFPFPTAEGHQGDLDKLERNILDALQGIIFVNDCQVVRCTKGKDWGTDAGVLIRVFPVEPGDGI